MTDKKVDQFVHLHSHADTSILDGFSTVPELVAEVSRLGQPALAITDHGNMHGIYELYKHAKAAGIKPIAGIEAYMTPSIVNRHHHAQSYLADGGRDDVSGRGSYTHITLLAENNIGLKNLYQMQLRSYTEGFYQKNRIDLELLELYGQGIIATTGCPSGEVQTRLRLGQEKEALAYAARLQDILGKDNVFMELMEHGMASELERGVRSQLLDIAKKLNMPLVATNDLHYARHEDSKGHEELLCVQTRSVMSNQPEYTGNGTRFAFEGDEYYVKSRAEMEKYFSGLPEALDNTLLIAERCDITIEPDDTLRPTVTPPQGMTEVEYLRIQAFEGLKKRLPEKAEDPEYIERLNSELGVIELKNYVGYFLVVSDFVRWGKFTAQPPVPTGHGRGCLSANTNVLTPLGFKKIKDIKVGDVVFDELGNQVVVPEVFEYDCDEPLVEIIGYYGHNGNKMTSDHKVLVSKANLETNPSKIKSGYRYTKEINEPIWVRADEVEVGDLVVMPKLIFANELKGFSVEPYSTVAQNNKLQHSIRNIAKNVGVSRNAVMEFVSNGGQVRGAASLKISEYLNSNSITVKDLVEQKTITTVLNKDFIEANHDMGFVLGLFISDGWIRQDDNTSIGFAQNKSEDKGTIPTMIEKVFGLKAHMADHKDKDIRQYTIRHKGVRELFANLFKDYAFNARTKYIPNELLNTNEDFRRGLLEGLWYGDGTHKGKSKYSTVSESLAQGVYTLLLSLGLPASLGSCKRIEKRPDYNKSGRESYIEYSVVTAHNFDVTTMSKGRGFDGRFNYYRVREVNAVAPEGKVYDFTVPTTNSYVTDSYVVHNSAAGSLLGYCLDITDVDPIKYDLLFERFINPERDSPPDIDMDFNDTDRERVIEYVKQRYGLDKVAQIATFGKIGAKAAIKDSVRILEKPYSMGDELSKALPEPVAGHPITLAEVYDQSAERYSEAGEFRTLVGKLDAQDVIDVARAFEGRTRSTGVHAAALVVSTKPVVETVPMMQRQADGAMITQWDYPTCEGLGLLKVDFLGLRNLGIIDNAVKNVYKTKGIKIDIQEIIQGEMDDKKTYELLTRGDSLGVFQLDSSGLRGLMKLLRPTSFQDISALIALYRPGPMGVNAHNDYALRKNGEQEVTPIHPELKEPLAEILDETYGLICYQEQIMRIAQKVADYTLAQADNLRRAMGKKKKSVLDAEYVPFSEGMKKNGYSSEAIKALWEILIPFADYGFNKCVSSRTKIRHSDGTAWEASEILKAYNNGEEIYLMAMWPDGEVRPHKVAKVVSTGIKPVFRLKTANGRSIEATHDHRLLTTRGYIKIEDMIVGQDELIVADKIYSEKQKENAISNIRKAHNLPLTTKQIASRSKTMSEWNNSESPEKLEQNARAAERMRKYQSKLTFEDRSAHQKYIDSITDRGDKIARIMRDKKAYMWENDPDFREKVITSLADIRRSNYDTGSGFGTTCFASNGMLCDSKNELRMAEFLISNDIEFEMHKLVGKGECDFYFAGLYWEMDGMDRHISYFENKYGDIPFVVVTPEDYMEKICTILKMEHVRNGDLIISIEPVSKRLGTIDIEMESDGPKNYITWKGIVSHNSHSVGYGVLSYLTAYLKANYPAEFMSALLSSVADDTDKTALYLDDCKNMGIKVLPPDINTSQADYAPISDTRINFGFKAIRGVGDKVAEEIVEIRGSKKFIDIHDFVNRVPKTLANKRILEALTLGGAFDSLGVNRRAMIESVPDITAAITKANRKPTKTQLAKLAKEGISEEEAMAMKSDIEFEIADVEEYSKLEKLKLERHALGLYISGHPLEGLDLSAASGNKVSDYLDEIIKPIDGWVPRDAKPLKLSGIVTSLSKKRTKKGETFAIGTVEDLTGAMPFVMFPKAFAQYGEFLQLDGVYQMQGFPRKRDIDGINFNVDIIRPLEFSDSGKLSLRLKLTEKQWASGRIALIERLERHKLSGEGATNIIVSIKNEEGEVWEETLDFTVKANPALTQEIRELFGMLSIGRWRKI